MNKYLEFRSKFGLDTTEFYALRWNGELKNFHEIVKFYQGVPIDDLPIALNCIQFENHVAGEGGLFQIELGNKTRQHSSLVNPNDFLCKRTDEFIKENPGGPMLFALDLESLKREFITSLTVEDYEGLIKKESSY